MGILEDCEQEFGIVTASITSKIGQLNTCDKDADKKVLIKQINSEFEECNEILEQIKLEIEGNAEKRGTSTHRYKAYNQEFSRLKNDFSRVKNLGQHQTDCDDFEIDDINTEQKQKLLSNSAVLEKVGREITEGYRIVLETEEISKKVLVNLSEQRETLKKSRNRIKETDIEIGKSSRILNIMVVRHIREKFILYFIAAVFAVGVALTLYFSFK